jgi:hypothetical protein
MNPVYYSVFLHSGHRDPKKRLSFELLIQIPVALSEKAPSDAYERLAIDAAKSVLRRRLSAHTKWVISASPFESSEIPRTTPKIAEKDCRAWILKGP